MHPSGHASVKELMKPILTMPLQAPDGSTEMEAVGRVRNAHPEEFGRL